jgi:hypothetical protein
MDTVHSFRSIRARIVYLIPLYSTGKPFAQSTSSPGRANHARNWLENLVLRPVFPHVAQRVPAGLLFYLGCEVAPTLGAIGRNPFIYDVEGSVDEQLRKVAGIGNFNRTCWRLHD